MDCAGPITALMRGSVNNYLELALDYAQADRAELENLIRPTGLTRWVWSCWEQACFLLASRC